MQLLTTTKARIVRRFALLLTLAFAVSFGAQDVLAQRTVTLHLNTASAPDTLTTFHDVQVRGTLTDSRWYTVSTARTCCPMATSSTGATTPRSGP